VSRKKRCYRARPFSLLSRYTYVDESGQDTLGEIFIVSVVITEADHDSLRHKLRLLEKESHKKAHKWTKARPEQRRQYIKGVLRMEELKGALYYTSYQNTATYFDLTVLSTAKAVHDKAASQHEATVVVDGLGKVERYRFAAGLRRLKVSVRKVRGVKDESDELIRLADALAGFVRDSLHGGNGELRRLFDSAASKGIIHEI
jgi:maltooligosyltrehalose synthase